MPPWKRPDLEPRRRDKHQPPLSPSEGSTGRAIVIGPYLRERSAAAMEGRAPDARLEEAVGLARAIDLDVVASGLVTLSQLRPATYIG